MAEPIYTYDDLSIGPLPFPPPPPLVYDEMCFYYDGGYDLICLQGSGELPVRKKRGGSGKSSSTNKKTYPELDFIDLVFKTNIVGFEKEKSKTYKVTKNNDLTIKINEFTITPKKSLVTSEIIKRIGISKFKISSDILPKKLS